MKVISSFRILRVLLPCACLLSLGSNVVHAQSPPLNVSFLYPSNGQAFLAPANIALYAAVSDSNVVQTVQYFSESAGIGIVTNSGGTLLGNPAGTTRSPFYMVWSNVPAGTYTLTAVATDIASNTATSGPVTISVTNPPPPPNVPFAVSFWYPTNRQAFLAPANIGVHALVTDSNVVRTVQYFSGTASIGIVTNTGGVLLTNTSSANPFFMGWSNVPAGQYTLTAVATDVASNTATSAPVTISVTNPPPPPNVPFAVSFWYPTNRQAFLAPANIGVHALVTDSNVVRTVQYFSGTASIGIVTNTGGVLLTNTTTANPFYMAWSNVPAGTYTLTAVATDTASNTATSAPVTISVTNPPPPHNVPFAVSFWYPSNGQAFLAPATIGVHAAVTDSNVVRTVQYFSGTASIGIVTNTRGVLLTNTSTANPFYMAWSNVPAGTYTLTAVATDVASNTATSAPVIINVSNVPPGVSIYAPDPVAVEGTNTNNWFVPQAASTSYSSGSNTATFLVRRDSGTNADLTIYFSIGGTASNGVDYAAIPSNVTIPAGRQYALITIVPLNDDDSAYRDYDTVVLTLTAPTNTPPPYRIGTPSAAGAIILEEDLLPIVPPTIRNLPDLSVHVSLPAANGLNFSLQTSSDLVNWLPVCTNTVLKGSAQFLDPNGAANPRLFYRIVPAGPPSY